LDLAHGFSGHFVLVILYWSFGLVVLDSHFEWSFWMVIFRSHFCQSFLVIENCVLTQILAQLQWRYYQQLIVGIILHSKDYLIMDGDSIDSGQDSRRLVGNDPEPNILLELERRSHGGSRPSGGASTQASIQSRGTF
jgi:hypothetical protein